MSKWFKWLFTPYVEDDVAVQVHSGVGYSGIQYSYYYGTDGRIVHLGVGYGGLK